MQVAILLRQQPADKVARAALTTPSDMPPIVTVTLEDHGGNYVDIHISTAEQARAIAKAAEDAAAYLREIERSKAQAEGRLHRRDIDPAEGTGLGPFRSISDVVESWRKVWREGFAPEDRNVPDGL